MAPSSSTTPTSLKDQRALRTIALFEAFKGLAALAMGIGLTQLLHQDVHTLAMALVGRLGLDPASPFPALLLHCADALNTTPLGPLEWMLGAYLILRWTEAYGLWTQQVWAEWLGALSGGLYIPFELYHLWHSPSLLSAGVLAINALIVLFLMRQLRQRQR